MGALPLNYDTKKFKKNYVHKTYCWNAVFLES